MQGFPQSKIRTWCTVPIIAATVHVLVLGPAFWQTSLEMQNCELSGCWVNSYVYYHCLPLLVDGHLDERSLHVYYLCTFHCTVWGWLMWQPLHELTGLDFGRCLTVIMYTVWCSEGNILLTVFNFECVLQLRLNCNQRQSVLCHQATFWLPPNEMAWPE